MKYEAFEQKLLALAAQTKDPITPAFISLHLGIPMQLAGKYLDKMTVEGHLTLESDDDGNLYYEVAGIVRGSRSLSRPSIPLKEPFRTGAGGGSSSGDFNPAVAGFLSLLLPGSGQLYRHEYRKGALFFILTAILYGLPIVLNNLYLLVLVVPAIAVHITSVAQAAKPPGPPAIELASTVDRSGLASELDSELDSEFEELAKLEEQREREKTAVKYRQ